MCLGDGAAVQVIDQQLGLLVAWLAGDVHSATVRYSWRHEFRAERMFNQGQAIRTRLVCGRVGVTRVSQYSAMRVVHIIVALD